MFYSVVQKQGKAVACPDCPCAACSTSSESSFTCSWQAIGEHCDCKAPSLRSYLDQLCPTREVRCISTVTPILIVQHCCQTHTTTILPKLPSNIVAMFKISPDPVPQESAHPAIPRLISILIFFFRLFS